MSTQKVHEQNKEILHDEKKQNLLILGVALSLQKNK